MPWITLVLWLGLEAGDAPSLFVRIEPELEADGVVDAAHETQAGNGLLVRVGLSSTAQPSSLTPMSSTALERGHRVHTQDREVVASILAVQAQRQVDSCHTESRCEVTGVKVDPLIPLSQPSSTHRLPQAVKYRQSASGIGASIAPVVGAKGHMGRQPVTLWMQPEGSMDPFRLD
jgi:hypothetical protein